MRDCIKWASLNSYKEQLASLTLKKNFPEIIYQQLTRIQETLCCIEHGHLISYTMMLNKRELGRFKGMRPKSNDLIKL
jgi:hypothetical protein